MADGSKIPLAEAPGSTPIKLAFRTGIKHVAAKNARPEKRVVIVNAVEATEAPESRRVSHVPLFEYPFLTLSFPPHSIGSVLWHAGIRPPNPRRSHRPGWLPPPPTTCPWNAPPHPLPAHGIGSTLHNIVLIDITPLASSCVSACHRPVRVG